MRILARRFFATVAVILVALYLVGGVGGVRQVRSRIRAWFQPPTAAELQRTPTDTATRLPMTATRTLNGHKIPLSDPPSIGESFSVVAGVMIVALLLMFATGRSRPPRAGATRV